MSYDVDVVVPCYNYARYLPACIDSVLSQPGLNVRILIIDDASSDNSAEVAAKLAADDSRVEFHRHVKNRGHIDTYNEGLLDWAKSRYSVLLSADDLLSNGSLGRSLRLMDANPDVGMTYGFATIFSDGEVPVQPPASDATQQIISGARYVKRVCVRGNAVPTPTAVVRTALQQKLGGYRKDLPHSGDMEMWLRFATHGRIGIVNAVQAFYRVHPASMSNQYYANVIRDRKEQLRAFKEACENSRGSIPQFAGWVNEMSRRLAEECFWVASDAFDRGELEKSNQCLEHALEFDPTIATSSMFRKYRLRRMIGSRNWRFARGLLAILGRKHSMPTALVSAPHSGQKIGWWPDPIEF